MFERFFLRFYHFFQQYKKWALALVLLITIAASAGVFFLRYDSNIDFMLPPDKEIMRSMDFLRDSSFSDKMIVSVALTDPARTKRDLFRAVDDLAASLQPPLFTKVVTGVAIADAMEEFSLLHYAPQVMGQQERAAIDKLLNEKTVTEKMRSLYRQSLSPQSVFVSSMSRTDPLGIRMLLMDKFRALPASMGYDVALEDGHFLSRDGRHALLIIQTSVPMMDSQKSKELVALLQERIKALPSFVSADIIGGHLHTISNEAIIIRDITVASIIASVAFFLLFAFAFRDARALFVFILPFIAVIWAMIITACIDHKLSYLVIGFGTSIVGISDVGLILYVAMKQGIEDSQLPKLAKLVSIDAITTIFSFVVLFFSVIRGYHQLALFSVICLFISLLFTLFILPLTLSHARSVKRTDPALRDRFAKLHFPAKFIIAAWVVLTGVFLFFSFSVKFESNVKKLDGTEASVLQAEQRFHEVWGGNTNQALFVVTGKNLEEALEINDKVFRDVTRTLQKPDFTSIAFFWPSEKTRKENRDEWDRFWKNGREKKLKDLIARTSGQYGFSEKAFAPFFEGLYERKADNANPSGLLASLQERFVIVKNGEYRIQSFFPDTKEYVDALNGIAKQHPGSFIVSGSAMSSSISAYTMKEMKILLPLAVLFNVVLTWFFFKNWKETMIALVPLITGVIWLLGIMALLNMPLNVVSIVAGIIASGVIVDYGLGITYEYRRNLHFGAVMSMTLSAATNIIGAGALLFAKHPALYSTAVAMVISMVIGYVASMVVIPSLCSVLRTPEQGAEG